MGGDKSGRLRDNVGKWKHLVREAICEEGSSNLNLKAFMQLQFSC